jgi:hypothetical protein
MRPPCVNSATDLVRADCVPGAFSAAQKRYLEEFFASLRSDGITFGDLAGAAADGVPALWGGVSSPLLAGGWNSRTTLTHRPAERSHTGAIGDPRTTSVHSAYGQGIPRPT